jgi:peroxiredoxin family protein
VGVLLQNKNAPDFRELFQSAVELGDAQVYPCSMALDILNISTSELVDYIAEPLGLTKFLDMASDSQVWSF